MYVLEIPYARMPSSSLDMFFPELLFIYFVWSIKPSDRKWKNIFKKLPAYQHELTPHKITHNIIVRINNYANCISFVSEFVAKNYVAISRSQQIRRYKSIVSTASTIKKRNFHLPLIWKVLCLCRKSTKG